VTHPPYHVPYRRSLLAVGVLSAGALALASLGSLLTRRAPHFYLVWNLFLALLPLGFALLAHRALHRGGWKAAIFPAALWLLFLPNSPYILTDFIHLTRTDPRWVWGHLLLLVWFSGAGLFAGLVSLRILHAALATRLSPLLTWVVISVVSLLTGLGVVLGRFERWNSWDALRDPGAIVTDVLQRLNPGSLLTLQGILPWALGAFFGLAYFTLWALGTDAAVPYSGMVSAGGSGRKNESANPTT
jgi:uncharacterized membrane protein